MWEMVLSSSSLMVYDWRWKRQDVGDLLSSIPSPKREKDRDEINVAKNVNNQWV